MCGPNSNHSWSRICTYRLTLCASAPVNDQHQVFVQIEIRDGPCFQNRLSTPYVCLAITSTQIFAKNSVCPTFTKNAGCTFQKYFTSLLMFLLALKYFWYRKSCISKTARWPRHVLSALLLFLIMDILSTCPKSVYGLTDFEHIHVSKTLQYMFRNSKSAYIKKNINMVFMSSNFDTNDP